MLGGHWWEGFTRLAFHKARSVSCLPVSSITFLGFWGLPDTRFMLIIRWYTRVASVTSFVTLTTTFLKIAHQLLNGQLPMDSPLINLKLRQWGLVAPQTWLKSPWMTCPRSLPMATLYHMCRRLNISMSVQLPNQTGEGMYLTSANRCSKTSNSWNLIRMLYRSTFENH